MSKNLWLYWENLPGVQEYPYISLCRKVIKYHSEGLNLRVVTPDNLKRFLPDLHPNIEKITRTGFGSEPCLAIKTGIIRVFLLEKYGGLYLDSDAIPLRPLAPILYELEHYEFIGVRRVTAPTKHVANNFMATNARGGLITEYANLIREHLDHRSDFYWGEIGAHMLTPLVDKNLAHVKLYPEEKIHPIVAEKQYLFMSKKASICDVIPRDAHIAMLFHDLFVGPCKGKLRHGLLPSKKGWLNGWSEERLYSANILLSKIFRHAYPLKDAQKLLDLN
ncbi:hypothetical protein A3709_10910 [Halioglobus sp. HI00S01]|uniref:glycosyltransferase n=1 Tax=Halioglobus sp. HI00S01 TaxID=1822214 RepID=UPI0007C35412|nr:glycosyltransferase [Halioglobus sp. HI00S01]KZX51320.1 hypothetical protein A3709_10910 [Halioglobus sp. HI00S01]